MHFDPHTLTFAGLSPEECREMTDWARSVVIHGRIPEPEPPWVTEILEATGASQRLLILSTVVPQRLLLSVVDSMIASKT